MKYLWDFFGPHAERTAQHFREHLGQFLVQHALDPLPTGLESAGEGHWAAFCIAPPLAQPLIEGALRPNRRLPVEPPSEGEGSAPS